MIFISAGLPGRFSEWCDAVTARLIEQALGSVEVLEANALDEFAQAVIATKASHTLIVSRQLGRLQKVLTQANRSFIVTLEDPFQALQSVVTRHGVEFTEAMRVVASSCAGAASCAALPGALVLKAVDHRTGGAAMARAIARHLDLAVDDGIIGEIVAALSAPEIAAEADLWLSGLDDPWRALASGALDSYRARFAGGDLSPITWERELFFLNEEQPEDELRIATRPVDVTGRPRHLIFGPYITLPPGSWSVTVSLGLSQEAAENSYVVDIWAERELAQARIAPGAQRLINVTLDVSIEEPLEQPLELRISNERAAFDGVLALGHVTVVPQSYLPPKTRNFFETALSG